MKLLIHAFFIMLLFINTFFGMGPVLLADGGTQERIWTVVIVAVIYFIIAYLYSRAIHWIHKQ